MTDSNLGRGSGRKVERFTRINDIRRDLISGVITIRASLEEVEARYGNEGWRQYKEVLRDVGYDHGCLVLVDDANDSRFVAMMEHFGRDISPEEARAYFSPYLAEYVSRERSTAREILGENVVRLPPPPTRFSIYRLPCGDYTQETTSFFEDRAEFIWQTRA